MKTSTIKTIKFVTAAAAVGVWVIMLREVFAMGGAFIEQAPYCIAGTMLIFGISTGIYKGLERWERRE
jgi:hypothetical protein